MGRKVLIAQKIKDQKELIEQTYQDGALLETKNAPIDYQISITDETEFLSVAIPFGTYREPCIITMDFSKEMIEITKYNDTYVPESRKTREKEETKKLPQATYHIEKNAKNIGKLNTILRKALAVQSLSDFSKACTPLNTIEGRGRK